ncbi:cysteine desulfurase [Candidatus Microgenomates bacterium]|nr:cysteine desulfurase [Candidatus Microgenomates bacterium]
MAGLSKIYLDYAAATPIDRRVLAVMAPYWDERFYNPAALYQPAREVKRDLERARAKIAKWLGARPSEILFTAGATESINLALRGSIHSGRDELIVSAIEHEAVLAAAGLKAKLVRVKNDGQIDMERLRELITDQTKLVSVGYVNGEVGTIQPIIKISRLIQQVRTDRARRGIRQALLFHTDAAQAAGYSSLAVNSLGVDLLTLSGSKIYGPKQAAVLYVRTGVNLLPLVVGGGQERGLRAGTENVAGIIGLAQALEIAQTQRVSETARLQSLRNGLIKQLSKTIKGVSVNGATKQRSPANLNITIAGVSGETLVHYLDQRGVMVSTGAACSANSDKPSHVLLALGLSKEQVNSSLRISLGRPTTATELKRFVSLLQAVVQQLRRA